MPPGPPGPTASSPTPSSPKTSPRWSTATRCEASKASKDEFEPRRNEENEEEGGLSRKDIRLCADGGVASRRTWAGAARPGGVRWWYERRPAWRQRRFQ